VIPATVDVFCSYELGIIRPGTVVLFVCVNVCGLVRPISARLKTEQKYRQTAKSAFQPLFAGFKCVASGFKLRTGEGIEPVSSYWEADILPLNYSRL